MSLSDADLAAIRGMNERQRGLLTIALHASCQPAWEEISEAVARTDKLLAELARLKDELEDLKEKNYQDGRDAADWPT